MSWLFRLCTLGTLFSLFSFFAVQASVPVFTPAERASVLARCPTLTENRFDALVRTVYFPDGTWQNLLNISVTDWTPHVCWGVSSYAYYCHLDHVIGYLALAFLNETTIPPAQPGDTIRHVDIILDSITEPAPHVYEIKYMADFFHLWNASINDYNVKVRIPIRQVQTFQSNSSLLERIYNDEDPVLTKILFDNGVQTDLFGICYLMQEISCTVASGRPRFASIPECVGFLQSLWPYNGQPEPICPVPFIGNTTVCRILHIVSTQPAPQYMLNNESMADLHCPHGLPKAPPPLASPCEDKCLVPCAGCLSSSAQRCEVIHPGVARDGFDYQCNCRPSYSYVKVGNFQGGNKAYNCTLQQCETVDDCPIKNKNQHRVKCNSETSTCECEESYVWDTSNKALKTKNVCVCPVGFVERIISHPLLGGAMVKRCIPPGRCQINSHCSAANTVCSPPYPSDRFTDYNMGLCVCAPGYHNGGLDVPCTAI